MKKQILFFAFLSMTGVLFESETKTFGINPFDAAGGSSISRKTNIASTTADREHDNTKAAAKSHRMRNAAIFITTAFTILATVYYLDATYSEGKYKNQLAGMLEDIKKRAQEMKIQLPSRDLGFVAAIKKGYNKASEYAGILAKEAGDRLSSVTTKIKNISFFSSRPSIENVIKNNIEGVIKKNPNSQPEKLAEKIVNELEDASNVLTPRYTDPGV